MCARFARGLWGALMVLGAVLPARLAAQDPSAPAPDPERGDVVAAPRLVKVLLIQPENAPVRPGFEPSLRIQLRGTAEVEVQRVAWPADLSARLADATQLAQERGAEWVVWADAPLVDPERATEDQVSVVYLVGKRQDRALIEVVRVPGGEEPDVDRSLALKVHELIGVRDGASYALGNAPLPSATPPGPEQPEPVAEPESSVALFLEGGAQLASEGNAGAVFDLVLAAGPGLRGERFAVDAPIEVQVGLGRSVGDARGEVSWNETAVGLALRGALRLSSTLRAGAFASVAIGFANARGQSPSGMRGEATETLPQLSFGVDAELIVRGPLSVRVALGLTQRVKRQRFAIDGQDVADLGRLLPSVRLSLLYRAW